MPEEGLQKQLNLLPMIDNFDMSGIWKGEYAYEDRFQPAIVKTAIPFVLRINSLDAGLFTGICQDDPAFSRVDTSANVYGKVWNYELFFVKKYPKTFILDHDGGLNVGDEPHPDIIHKARITFDQRITGTWQIERTFRNVSGRLTEIPKIGGQWWIERF